MTRNIKGQFSYSWTRNFYIIASAIILTALVAFTAQLLAPIRPVEAASDCKMVDGVCDLTEPRLRAIAPYIQWHTLPEPPKEGDTSPEGIMQLIRYEAWSMGMTDEQTQLALDIVDCESNFQYLRTNGRNSNPVGSVDRGLVPPVKR
jgi:hypothetical protein